MTVPCANDKKHTSRPILLRQNAEFSVLNLLVHILTTKPQKIKKTSRLTVPMTTASCYEQLKKKQSKYSVARRSSKSPNSNGAKRMTCIPPGVTFHHTVSMFAVRVRRAYK